MQGQATTHCCCRWCNTLRWFLTAWVALVGLYFLVVFLKGFAGAISGPTPTGM